MGKDPTTVDIHTVDTPVLLEVEVDGTVHLVACLVDSPESWASFIGAWGIQKGWAKKQEGTTTAEIAQLLNKHLSDGILVTNLTELVADLKEQIKPPRSVGDWAALAHSEISEAYEEYRNGYEAHEVYFTEDGKPEGQAMEYADALIRIFHWFHTKGINVNHALAIKMNYNLGRPYLHGGKLQ